MCKLSSIQEKTALPSLKSRVSDVFQSHVVYRLTCSGCNASYVGQTTRHLTTRLREHGRPRSKVGQHLLECNELIENVQFKIIDKSDNVPKLLTLEALHISRIKPRINTRDEYRSRELTLRFTCREAFLICAVLYTCFSVLQFIPDDAFLKSKTRSNRCL